MRRLWSYIILTGASIALMGASFCNVFKRSTSNIEYSDGKELVFRIEDKDGGDLEEENEDGKMPSEVIASSMIERLEALEVTNYEVATESYDTVKVTLKQNTESNYENVQNLMTFNGALALSSKVDGDKILVNTLDDEKFVTGDAYLETKNNYPTVNIPVGDHFKELYEVVKEHKANGDTDAAEASTDGEGDDAETTYTYCLYLWHDYEDGDTYDSVTSSQDAKIASKIFMSFDIADLEAIEDDGDEIEKLTAYINIQDANSNSSYEASEVRTAFDTAKYYVALINSGELDYDVTYLYSYNVNATTEQLVDIGSAGLSVQWSATLRATLVCIFVVALLLAALYRLSSLAVVTTTLASVFAGVSSIILFTAEFNAAGLIALAAVSIASLACGILYLTKVKDEAYRGRSLKKANSEAAKKSLLPIVDINVVLIVLGVFAYVFGGTLMRSFAVISVIGGLASLILNTLVLRLFMWLATNATKLQGKYETFGIDSKNVPNLLKEEKQTYFGSYVDKDFTKKKKPVGIISAILLVAGIAGMVTFGVISNTDSYKNKTSDPLYTEIFIETDVDKSSVKEPLVSKILENTYLYQDDETKTTKFSSYVEDIIYEEIEETVTEEGVSNTVTHIYCVVRLNATLDESAYNAYYVELDEDGNEIGSRVYSTDLGGISALLLEKVEDSDANISFKDVVTVTNDPIDFYPIIWGTLVGIAVCAFYLLLRYRLSRGLASLIIPAALASIVAGVLAFLRLIGLSAVNYAIVALPVIAMFSFIVGIFFMNRERELVLEDKTHDNSVENRNAIMVRANSLAYSSILMLSILAVYISVNFFGFGATGNSWMFLVLLVSIFVVVFVEVALYGPISQWFYKLFSKVNMEKFSKIFKRKKKQKVIKTPRSAEPEERTFIGIND